MAFVFVGGASNSGTATSSSVTHGLTIGAGDLVVLYVNRNDSITIDNDAGGFTELLQETPPSGETASHALFFKISAGSEPATYTNTLNGNDLFQAIVQVWTSDSDAVVDASVTSAKQSTGSTSLVIEATRNVVISDNALSIVVGGKDRNNGSFTYTSADGSYGNTLGGNGGRYTGIASRIYTTGKTFGSTEDITLSITGTGEVSDTAYSMHVSFVESAAVTAAITGTMTTAATETEITDGGNTIIVTLTGDTFKAAGTGPIGSTADTQALIDGFDAASSPTNGWNNEVRDKALTSEIVRTSSTVATWTVAAQAGYDISSQEVITGTIPVAVLVTGAGAVTATPTFTIDPVAVGLPIPVAMFNYRRRR